MDSDSSVRAARERAAYNEGGVHTHSTRLQSRFSHVFVCPNALHANRLFDSAVADAARGRTVLEYGCHNGWTLPALAASVPLRILAIDISEKAVAEAKRNHGEIAAFGVMDGHHLALANDSLDVVIGRAILHHLDFEAAVLEIHRVLRPGGHALFVEPLRDNPAGKLIRMITPMARTRDELPLSRGQIRRADGLFSANRHFFAGLVSVASGMVSSLVSSEPGNAFMRLSHRLDLALARTPFKWWMRMVVLHWVK